MRAVIDTCVIVDALQNREPFCKDAQSVFLLCANRQYEGFLTAKAVTDIYYLTHRQTHSGKATREILTKLCTLFSLFDTAAIDIRKAISAEISDFEDAQKLFKNFPEMFVDVEIIKGTMNDVFLNVISERNN